MAAKMIVESRKTG